MQKIKIYREYGKKFLKNTGSNMYTTSDKDSILPCEMQYLYNLNTTKANCNIDIAPMINNTTHLYPQRVKFPIGEIENRETHLCYILP